jgi:hypothetical protein
VPDIPKLDPEARYIQPAELRFDEEPHRYTLMPVGRELPSVTRRMAENRLGFNPEGIPEAILERASARGSYVHAGSCLIDQGDLDDERVPAEYAGYFAGYRKAIAETRFDPRVSEIRLYSKQWSYAGSPDKVGMRGRWRIGWEIKTGATDDVDVQAGAYDGLWREWFPWAEIDVWECLRLGRDGSYRLWELDVKNGLIDFHCCLRVSARREARGERMAA